MMATELPVDLTTSFAQRVGGELRLVLGLPELPEGASELQLSSGKRQVTARVTAADAGDVVEALIPADQMSAGVWKLALLAGEESIALEARLLANRRQPVALLPGPKPDTRMSPPRPREVAGEPARTQNKLRRVAARTVDTALAVLPEERRTKTRSALAKVGRRVLR